MEESTSEIGSYLWGTLYERNAIWVTVVPDGVGESIDAEMIKIEGHEIQYQYLQSESDLQREHETVAISMNLDGIGYRIAYSPSKENIEEAKAFAKDIILNNSTFSD